MTPSRAQKLADHWQHRLMLCDWRIEWSFEDVEFVDSEWTMGLTSIFCDSKAARVRIALRHPAHVVEENIAHELFHVCCARMRDAHGIALSDDEDSERWKLAWRHYESAEEDLVVRLQRLILPSAKTFKPRGKDKATD